MANPPSDKVRFSVRGMMLYTVVCCICFGLFSRLGNANTNAIPNGRLLGDWGMLAVCLAATGVAGLGEDAFRTSFNWVGKVCMSLVFGLIVTILAFAFCTGQGVSREMTLLFASGSMASGVLVGLVLGFRPRLPSDSP